MSYDVSTYIDLTYLNKEVAKATPKKSFTEEIFSAIKVSEEKYIFRMARQIPVTAL